MRWRGRAAALLWLAAAAAGATGLQGVSADGPQAVSAAGPQAASADGRWTLAGDEADGLVLRDAAGTVQRRYPARSLDGRERGRVQQVLALPARRSFLVSFQGLPEWWEIALDPNAEPVFDGLVHDYRMGEGLASAGFLGVRRTRLSEPLLVVSTDGAGFALGRAAAPRADGRLELQVIQLDVRKAVARFAVAPDLQPGW